MVNAPVDCEPVAALLPDQEPPATQAVALLAAQVRVDEPPLAMVLGLALKLTVVLGLALTVTVADCEASPPLPEHVSVYVELLFNAPVDCVPLTLFGPCQPPLAVQVVALTEVQLIVELPPLETALGPALSEIVGAAALTLTVVD